MFSFRAWEMSVILLWHAIKWNSHAVPYVVVATVGHDLHGLCVRLKKQQHPFKNPFLRRTVSTMHRMSKYGCLL